MTDRQLKMYALGGMLVRLHAEQEKLLIEKTESRRQQIQRRIDIIKKHYTETLYEIQGKYLVE